MIMASCNTPATTHGTAQRGVTIERPVEHGDHPATDQGADRNGPQPKNR